MSAYLKPDMTIEAMLAPTKIALLEEELAECKVWSNAGYEALGTQIKKTAELETELSKYKASDEMLNECCDDLAASQAREAKLREALSEIDDHAPWGGDNVDDYIRWMRDVAKQALALSADDSALLEAAERFNSPSYPYHEMVCQALRRMAEELK